MSKAATVTENPINTYACQVTSITPLSKDTFQVELVSPDGTTLNYQAGQYLQLELDVNRDGAFHSLSYSIANRFNPEQPRRLQLFIQNSSDFAEKVLTRLAELKETNVNIAVTLPMGRAFLQTDLGLIHVLIAAGSGISKIKCLTEEILEQQPDADVNIYWSNKNVGDFYLLDEFQRWVTQYKHLNFTAILESASADWPGRSGYIYQVIKEDFDDLKGVQAYLCGSPQMVYGTIDQLKSRGLKEAACYSDVFEYAPRDQKIAI
ncbi:NAD(P)H-flavin reductase [Litoribrevibacter euphylliae]|uniref:NAD(P)H-flavin reductase n=1 Tax=Litoribrevibacter euphylliae TaxID=1834034 RepID=A0ABV7H9Z3_9GAMM